MTIPIKINKGTAISWSFNMVEFVFKVIRRPVSLKLSPQIPKPNAKKINVNDIGKPIKITKIMVPNMIKPIIGFGTSNIPPFSNKLETPSKIGKTPGTHISRAIKASVAAVIQRNVPSRFLPIL